MPSISPLKTTAITLAAALTISVAMPITSANAGGRHKGDLIAAGVIGLALGAIIADSSHRRQQRVDHLYYDMPSYAPPQPVGRYNAPAYTYYPDAGNYHNKPHRHRHQRRPDRESFYQPEPTVYNRDYKPAYQPAPPARYKEPKVITYNDQPTYGAEPWSADWYSYCRGKFRSFNAKSGTYLGYDGKRHFCVAK